MSAAKCGSRHGPVCRARGARGPRRRPRSGELATGVVGYGLRDFGDEMSQGNMTGYLPGDPRYGLSGEALRNYYRTKPAQWAIYCWDKPGTEATRRALLQNQKSYVKHFGERVIGYGHFVSDNGRARPTIAARACSSSCARDPSPARLSSSASTSTRTSHTSPRTATA